MEEQQKNQIIGHINMRNFIFKYTFVYILFTYGCIEVNGQIISSNLNEERISLFTDRTLYISGEQVHFVAYLFCDRNSYNQSSSDINKDERNKNINSNIIYVELITPEGDKIASGKYLCEKSYSAGIIKIPKDILTGNYYIRAYSKFMRNNGPNAYSYTFLKIVNPFKPDILSYTHTTFASEDTIISQDTLNSQEFIKISLDKKEYLTRNRVNIQIKGVDLYNNPLRALTLTVIPDYSYISSNSKPLVDKSLMRQFYYPETNGMSLTGRLKENKSDNALPNTVVNLSILGDCKDFMAVLTDSMGRFFFKMPNFIGVKDIFLCTETLAESKSTILIDNDFCSNEVKLPTSTFHLNEMEKKTAYNMALNVQLGSHFNRSTTKDSSKYANKAFYGKPQENLIFDNYIQLPTIEDYINEIIPLLKIKTHQKRKYFKIYSTQVEMDIYKPLVLLDLVAIDNPEKILSLSPQSISHIELVDAPYVKGDITYGGIISLFSKKGDFAGVDLPTSGVFLDFNFLADSTDSNIDETLTTNRPDVRNTLFWEPNIIFNSSNSKEFTFTTSDAPGRYIVLLRGITNKGKAFTFKQSFVVGN